MNGDKPTGTWVSKVTGVEWFRLDPKKFEGHLADIMSECKETYNANLAAREKMRRALSDYYRTDLDIKFNRFGVSITPRRSEPPKAGQLSYADDWLGRNK